MYTISLVRQQRIFIEDFVVRDVYRESLYLSPKLSTLNLSRSFAFYTCKNRSLFSSFFHPFCPSSSSSTFFFFLFCPFNFCFACIFATIPLVRQQRIFIEDFVVRDVLRLCGEGTATWEFGRNAEGIFIPVARPVCWGLSFLGDLAFFSLPPLFLFFHC